MEQQTKIIARHLNLPGTIYHRLTDAEAFHFLVPIVGEGIAHIYVQLFIESRANPNISSNVTGYVEILTGTAPETFESFLNSLPK